ncbi:MAG: DUF2235 domain-containing protein, partial [Polaromonas sp.]|nr:DUF2235 domain-containing protein [Polaromonas sp.]
RSYLSCLTSILPMPNCLGIGSEIQLLTSPAECSFTKVRSRIQVFDAHKDDGSNIRARYIPGVGTPYADIGDTGGTLGSSIGKGADQRIKKALELLDEEIDKVPAQQTLRLINVSVFGFSRGAAQARAFIRDLAAKCKADDGAHVYRGKPVRVAFTGLFDTVCSAYDSLASATLTTNGGHNGWAHDMKLPPMVEQTVHMNAAHELRRRFPLDSTRIDAGYPDNTVEIWYPGVHSDVGGGYELQYQGRENTISRFALNQMFDLAFGAGVLFQRLEELDPVVQREFNKDDPDLRAAFNAYIDAVPVKTGPMEVVQAAHMELWHRWLKKRVTSEVTLPSVSRMQQARQSALAVEREKSREVMRLLNESPAAGAYPAPLPAGYEQAAHQYRGVREARLTIDDCLDDLREEDAKYLLDVRVILAKARRRLALTLREKTIQAAWENETPLPVAVESFFDRFSHDSVAHFDYDTSRLSDWRTIFFGNTKYKPS